MFSLSEILKYSYSNYMFYVQRKTNFILKPQDVNQLRWFWQHIVKNYNYKDFWAGLAGEEKKAFLRLLLGFCYSSEDNYDQHIMDIEKKSMWIFKHPLGGICIPLEFIKMLMDETSLESKNYLFSLLYRLKFREQNGLNVLIQSAYDIPEITTKERNAWDMALVLYILFANFHTTGLYRNGIGTENKLVPFRPNSFLCSSYTPPLLHEPTPMWNYLYKQFAYLRSAVDEWYDLMHRGKKGIYRSLTLVSQPKEELIFLFSSGYFLPVFTKSTKDISAIQLVTPAEIIYQKEHQLKKSSIRIK